MKRCPQCNRVEADDALAFCRADGTPLVGASSSLVGEGGAARHGDDSASSEIETSILPHTTDAGVSRATAPTTALPYEQPAGTTRELKRPKRGPALLAFMLLIVAASAVACYFYLAKRESKAVQSIAVMPFVNESGDADAEYLSDGMTETLISSLSQLPNLSVKARSSVFRYKGKDADAKTVGRELNVQAILNGRVMQRGDQLTLTLELVDAPTENVLWSEQYNRRQADIVSLQSEIARDVLSKLKPRLSGADEAKVTKKYTVDPEAYELYLKGRFQWNKRGGDSLRQAAGFYQQAIEKDPGYALAYAGLAETYSLYPDYSVASPQDSFPKSKAAALRALELDDSIAEAHTALGRYYNYWEWNRAEAEREYRRAIELKPNYATAHHWLGTDTLAQLKRFDEAIAEAKLAEELDPLSPIIATNLADTLLFERRYDEAIAQYRHSLTLDPNFYFTYVGMSNTLATKGEYGEAIALQRKAMELSNDPIEKGYLAFSLAKSGRRDEALKLLDELKREASAGYVPSYAVGLAYLDLKQKDEAFVWLEKDADEHGITAAFYAVDPLLDDLRPDPRFADLLRRVGFRQ
ncbi:MAG: hypothetical protein M3268_04790 [Acidobacteriota bacterium]|nr:hypothetical protein [Acidobacteriota bacterium]